MNNEIQIEVQKAIAPLQDIINDLMTKLSQYDLTPANNVSKKEYLTIEEVENFYGIKKSMQAKLRMDKKNGIPYVRPAGAKIVLYPVNHLDAWLEEWRAV